MTVTRPNSLIRFDLVISEYYRFGYESTEESVFFQKRSTVITKISICNFAVLLDPRMCYLTVDPLKSTKRNAQRLLVSIFNKYPIQLLLDLWIFTWEDWLVYVKHSQSSSNGCDFIFFDRMTQRFLVDVIASALLLCCWCFLSLRED